MGREHRARPFEVGGSIDTERNGVNDLDIDPHARFQRPQLFQRFPLFQRRGCQRHEGFERLAAIGVETDVMIERAGAVRRGRARPAIATALPGVFLAGDYTDPEYPPTLEAAVRSGVRAAELALAR